MDYSFDEKQELNKKLRDELSRQQAEQLGVDSSDMMQRVTDGKSAWVKKSETYIQLDKQRKLVAPQKAIRALRGGENSLVSRIKKEVEHCREQITYFSSTSGSQLKGINDHKTSITKLENRTHNISSTLSEVESRIERAKADDPVFEQAEAILGQVRLAQEKQDSEQTEKLLTYNKDLLVRYDLKRKSLAIYFEEARKYRTELQKEYSQIMQIRFKLQAISIQQVKKSLAENVAIIHSEVKKSEILHQAAAFHKLEEDLKKQFMNLSSHFPTSQVSIQDASRIWDCIIPEMVSIIKQQMDLLDNFKSLIPQQTISDMPDLTPQRMVFSRQKK
jgi:hypothetical protein